MADIEKLDLSMAGERCDDAVLPCPFCGSKNIAYGKYEHTAGRRYAIVCMNCMAQIDPGWAQSWGAVQGMWNRRAQPENEPLTCKDCVYWKDRQVQLRDGSCRDYMPNEPWSVTVDVGINVASHCTLHGFDNESGSWFWAKAEDFCSRGIRKPERSEG